MRALDKLRVTENLSGRTFSPQAGLERKGDQRVMPQQGIQFADKAMRGENRP